jgi:hypothetical protein
MHLLSRARQLPGTHFFKARHANSQANVQRWQFVLTASSTRVAHRAAIMFRASLCLWWGCLRLDMNCWSKSRVDVADGSSY